MDIWTDATSGRVYAEALSLPGLLLSRELSSVTEPLDFTGLTTTGWWSSHSGDSPAPACRISSMAWMRPTPINQDFRRSIGSRFSELSTARAEFDADPRPCRLTKA
jgi:hypothetical protein